MAQRKRGSNGRYARKMTVGGVLLAALIDRASAPSTQTPRTSKVTPERKAEPMNETPDQARARNDRRMLTGIELVQENLEAVAAAIESGDYNQASLSDSVAVLAHVNDCHKWAVTYHGKKLPKKVRRLRVV